MPEPLPPLSLRFANTARGRERDPIATPAALVAWLEAEAAGAPSGTFPDPATSPGAGTRTDGPPALRPSPPEARRLFDEAFRLRGAFIEILEAACEGRIPPGVALAVVERALTAGRWRRGLGLSGRGLALEWVPVPSADPLGRLAPLASDLIDVLSGADPGRLRTCAAEECGRWFLDTSRGGQRRWCSMATCGNRAKAERWRARHGSA